MIKLKFFIMAETNSINKIDLLVTEEYNELANENKSDESIIISDNDLEKMLEVFDCRLKINKETIEYVHEKILYNVKELDNLKNILEKNNIRYKKTIIS